jgi:epsilon-lactone hydrolase
MTKSIATFRGLSSKTMSVAISAVLLAAFANAQKTAPSGAPKPKVAADGTVEVPAFAIPFSALASEQAKKNFLESVAHPLPVTVGNIHKTRQDIDKSFHKPLLQHLRAVFPVTITPEIIGGVQTDVIVPNNGISAKNKSRVLINVHGGGFEVGARLGGQIESVPIASLGQIKVITVDYRMAPEHQFPAASEDVAAVYRGILKRYKPKNIGIYGASAGGIITTETIAWFQTHDLPRPGAVGLLVAGGIAGVLGDSLYTGQVLNGGPAPRVPPPPRGIEDLVLYFGSSEIKDPMPSPAFSTPDMAKFPLPLVITGTRDELLSDAVYTHTQLVKAGVDAELHVWEGMRHGFVLEDTAESREVWDVMIKFFDSHLGKSGKAGGVQ